MAGKAKDKSTTAMEESPEAFAEGIDSTRCRNKTPDFGGGVLERRSISEQVVNRIMAMIKSGNLKAGDRLPTEAQMGIAFGISRPSLREALKALTLMGVLESRQGGHHAVTDLSPSRLVAPFNIMLSIGDYEVDEHFEARKVVDLELVRLCCLRSTREERDRILRHALDGRGFLSDPIAFRLLDVEFHRYLNEGADNRLLTAVAQGLYDIGLELRRAASAVPGHIEKSVSQHIAIAEAIIAADAPAAVAAYAQHLDHIRQTTIEAMLKAAAVS